MTETDLYLISVCDAACMNTDQLAFIVSLCAMAATLIAAHWALERWDIPTISDDDDDL